MGWSWVYLSSQSRAFKVLVFTIILLISIIKVNAQINATLVFPTHFGSCIDTVFTFKYTHQTNHSDTISAVLSNAANNCQSTNTRQLLMKFDSCNVVGATSTFNSDSSKIIIQVPASTFSGQIIIRYHVYIDCSILSGLGSNPDIIQTFKCTDASFDVDSSGTNISTYFGLTSPKIVGWLNSNSFNFSYHDTSSFKLRYRNFSSDTAHIAFTYFINDTTLCGYGSVISYQYSVDSINFFTFYPHNKTHVTIPPFSDFYIKQFVTENFCPSNCDTLKAFLSWQCSFDTLLPNVFCSKCFTVDTISFSINSNDNPVVLAQQLSPSTNASSDFSCFNNVAGMTQWSYRFVMDLSSHGAADTLRIILTPHSNFDVNYLSLISKSSLQISGNLSGTISIDTIESTQTLLCSNLVSDPVQSVQILISDFRKCDTLLFSFKTFRCAEDEDSLLGTGKRLNQWEINTIAFTKCNTVSTNSLISISNEDIIGYPNIKQQLFFFPLTNNLSVPHNSIFGDSLDLKIICNGIFDQLHPEYKDYQYLGCNHGSAYSCSPKGTLRVKISLGLGLVLHSADSLVYFKSDTGVSPLKIFPDFYYNTINDTVCEAGDYFFYFHLSDTLLYLLDSGLFISRVQSCCGGQLDAASIKIAFYILPNPSGSCYSINYPVTHDTPPTISDSLAAFIPLSSVSHSIHVHCPGCIAPGAIADAYRLDRIKFGLQDSNNNGLADNSLTAIDTASAWFDSYKDKLAINNSSFGDELRDYFTTHFQDGDNTGMHPGYTYQMMQDRNSIFKYLQLSVIIPQAFDTLDLATNGLNFYVDVDTSGGTCIECNEFKVANNWRTILQLHVPNYAIHHYLEKDSATGTYYFTFSTVNDTDYYLLNPLFAIVDSLLPFTKFNVNQRYRLTTSYMECGTFASPSLTSDIEQATIRSEITARCWFSGKKQNIDAFTYVAQMPNPVDLVHAHGWTFDTIPPPPLITINQLFADSFLFYCEFNGTNHYFFSQDVLYSSYIIPDRWRASDYPNWSCGMDFYTNAISRTAGGILDIYPFEYRPPALASIKYWLRIPSGYHEDSVFCFNYFKFKNGNQYQTFDFKINHVSPLNDTIFISNDSLPQFYCMTDTAINDKSKEYVQDNIFMRTLVLRLQPDHCDEYVHVRTDTMANCFIDSIHLSYINVSTCSFVDSLKDSSSVNTFISKANLQVKYNKTNPSIFQHHVGWNVTISNPNVIIDTLFGIPLYPAAAAHVYVVTPSILNFNNWIFVSGTDTVFPVADSLLFIADTLVNGGVINGTVFADYNDCLVIDTLVFKTGYECLHYPDTPFVATNSCFFIIDSVPIRDAKATIDYDPIAENITYNLCEPFKQIAIFNTSDYGFVYPDSIVLNIPSGNLNVLNVALSKCNDTSITKNLISSGILNHWLINRDSLISLGYYDGSLAYNYLSCITFIFTFEINCSEINELIDHNFKLFSHDFCNDTTNAETNQSNYVYSGINHCNDCFSISKTANNDSILVGDTITYTVTACANNQFPHQINVIDSIPPNFTVTSTIPSLPYSGWIGADTCITFIVKGVFSKSNYDSCFNNVAWLKDSVNNLWHDDTCISVMPPCYLTGMIILPDSTNSSTLTATTNKSYYIDSTLVINSNITFSKCTLYVATGGSIVVLPGDTLSLDSSSVEGCGYMWQGLKIDTTAFIYSKHSRVRDGDIGIAMKSSGGFWVDSSQVIDCVIGIYVPQRSCGVLNTTKGVVQGTTFGLERAAFLPNFSGQALHGFLPKAGVDISDMNITFGNYSAKRNFFHNLNMGIVTYRTYIDLYNSVFRNIYSDTAYSDDYSGTAIVSLGQQGNCHINGDLVIQQLPNNDTLAKDIYRGIYTRYSNLLVAYNKIINSTIGIYSNNTDDGLHALVTGCLITAASRGINWYGNAGAYYMAAEYDTINISGDTLGIGIKLTETTNVTANHHIENNVITITEGRDGINASAVLKPSIINNKIYQLSNGTNHPTTRGIYVDGCDTATISCNTVYTNYPDTLTVSFGLHTSDCKTYLMECNSVKGHYRGFWFGGTCNTTDEGFKGNSIDSVYEGLFCNNTAKIGVQTLEGNLWNSYTGNKGARGATGFTVSFSIFWVNGGTGPQLPSFTPSGWFKPLSGSVFACGNTCETQTFSQNSNNSYRLLVAKDSATTSVFIPENKSMAKEVLFEELTSDKILRNSDTVFVNFFDSNLNSSIGKQTDVKEKIIKINKLTPFDEYLISMCDSLMKIKSDSIHLIDSLVTTINNGNFLSLRNNLIAQLSILRQTRNNILSQNEIASAYVIDSAETINSTIIAQELPEENWKFINDMLVRHEKYGKQGISNYYTQILSIAQQCPFAGGRAVYIARNLIELFNDRMIYDDDATCLQNGIFRETEQLTFNDNSIKVIPNPANNLIKIEFENNSDIEYLNLTIINTVGEIVVSKQFKQSAKPIFVDVSKLSIGVYIVQAKIGSTQLNSKLIIVR